MKQAKLGRRQLALLVVVIILTILAFIVVAALTLVFITNQLNTAEAIETDLITFRSPLDTDQIDPALALASLGGVPESDIISEAIEKERAETALAATLFHPTLSDADSAGSFLLLAPIYTERGEREKGLFCYRLAGLIATLSPELTNTARTDLFFQVSQGLTQLNEPELAKFYLDQAFIIALRSPFLQTVHRRTIFEQLQRGYIALGERELARRSLDLSANPPDIEFVSTAGAILPAGAPVILPEAVQAAEANRWLRAQELAALLVERGGTAPPAAYEALRTALIDEDREKLQFYDAELDRENQIGKRIDLAMAKVAWLSTKHRIARQGFGLSLVPEWETQAEPIRADLTKAYEVLYAAYADLIITLPTATQVEVATAEKLRREVLAGELGRYPNYPELQRQKQLLEAMEQLMVSQPELNVFIGARPVGEREMFTFISPTAISEE